MQKLTSHSRSSLFLMEMILSILILALTCTACVRIFAAAKTQRQEARELNHTQELATCAGEALEGWDGELSSFSQIFETAANVSDSEISDSDGTISSDSDSSISSATDASVGKTKNASKNSRINSPVESYLLNYYYDREWNSCDKTSAEYNMSIQLIVADYTKTADLNFYNSANKNLYHLSISFPLIARKDNPS
ncbi:MULTISPECIES: hypothetical protein [unclassified Blautia]|uniref:hypothetical protein n=1 Tax=unclassified Blautia TaxID=2648079 RepID=UPI003F8B394B